MAGISNKVFGITDQAASTTTTSNKVFGITDQAGGGPRISNKALDEIGVGIYEAPNARQQVAGRAHTASGGIQFQLDNVDQGTRRQSGNVINSDPPNAYVRTAAGIPAISLFLNPGSDAQRDLPEVGLIARIPGVDLTVLGSVPILTTPGRSIVCLGCAVVVTSLAGFVAPPRCGLGFNATLDNVYAEQELTGLDSVGAVYEFLAGGTSALCEPPLSTISLGVDLAANATTMVAEILLYGYVRRS